MMTSEMSAVRKSIPPSAVLGSVFFRAGESGGGSGFQKIVGLARAAKAVKLNQAVLLRGVTLGAMIKYWEIIADNLTKAGWSWGCVSVVDSRRRTIFVADAHRSDGKRFVVRADERLTAFGELESAICGRDELS
jgi:hypothetical protein